jgi:hypothetical protein
MSAVEALLLKWEKDADEYLNLWGMHMPFSLEMGAEMLRDALAIDKAEAGK